jgi:protein ImuB
MANFTISGIMCLKWKSGKEILDNMKRRYVSIWFQYLLTDWICLKEPLLRNSPLVVSSSFHGRMIISAVNEKAGKEGIVPGMALADARAIHPGLEVRSNVNELDRKLLHRLAEWCIQFSPAVAVDMPEGLILDATGCSHLWGGDEEYISSIKNKLEDRGYAIRVAMADTIGIAWSVARYGTESMVLSPGSGLGALLSFPPSALRLEPDIVDRLLQLGMDTIGDFIGISKSVLRRRFGKNILDRIDEAAGNKDEDIKYIVPVHPYQERLPSLEPIVTVQGIEIALKYLLKSICDRLRSEQKGLRECLLKFYRTDGQVKQLVISTTNPSNNIGHLYKLFGLKLETIEPGPGIDVFVLEALKVEEHVSRQEKLWENVFGLKTRDLAELLDRITGRLGSNHIHRYIPEEHYWPEKSVKSELTMDTTKSVRWDSDRPRPLQLLSKPEKIEVTAPIPDYPPMMFRYKGALHRIAKADGPERIEQEWWSQEGEHRDYYYVEDDAGKRYWLFRLGHYDSGKAVQWFIHGFFA